MKFRDMKSTYGAVTVHWGVVGIVVVVNLLLYYIVVV